MFGYVTGDQAENLMWIGVFCFGAAALTLCYLLYRVTVKGDG